MRARHQFCCSFPIALLALSLLTSGIAAADDVSSKAMDAAELPDAVNGPGSDRIPPGLACRDAMDFAPEDNERSPFDADLVKFSVGTGKAHALPVSSDNGCPNPRKKADKV